MTNLAELHIAENIQTLDVLAKSTNVLSKVDKFERICTMLEKLYKGAQDNILDQEKAYIYLVRFFAMLHNWMKYQHDEKFIKTRFETQIKRGEVQMGELRESLIKRYKEKAALGKQTKQTCKKDVGKPMEGKKVFFSSEFISCSELYSALNQTNNILLVDVRPEEDYKKSKIKVGNCINIPDRCISSGLSAHGIGLLLSPETQAIWNKRHTFDVMVLFDWDSDKDSFMTTKLEKLKSSLLEWDLNEYSQKPVVLNGGYMEWLQIYPTLCTNHHVFINKINNELDELLNLDDIQYPSTDENITPAIFNDSISSVELKENLVNSLSQEDLLKRATEIASAEDKVMNAIDEKLKQKEHIDKNIKRYGENQKNDVEKELSVLQMQLESLLVEKKAVDENLKLHKPQTSPTITDVNDNDEKSKIYQNISEQRRKELEKARALKPKASGDIENRAATPKPTKPKINRATKPAFQQAIGFSLTDAYTYTSGNLVGLRNIRNTCYMNTIVQCMRYTPALAKLFRGDYYLNYVTRKPDAMVRETAFLMKSLWTHVQRSFDPIRFYDKVCSLETTYKLGNHEDCMEFFLFLLNHLSEDCSKDIPRQNFMTPLQEAWCNQLGGKSSIFVDLFYHQIRIVQVCRHCDRTSYKFEIESTFMLSVPEHDFKLEHLMEDYLKDYVIDDYCCSKCKKPVTNRKTVIISPKILVIVLKRYKQVARNQNLVKIDSRGYFPLQGFRFGNATYTLNSIAMHSGSMMSGHYTAACMTDNRWYEFNDENVRPIDIDDDAIKIKACAFFFSKNECDIN